ncbi:hypothetical protein ACFL34_04335 [Candidatus Sumerlaeota bacterium]
MLRQDRRLSRAPVTDVNIIEDTDGQAIGPAAHLLRFVPGPGGELAYRTGVKPAQHAFLGAQAQGQDVIGLVLARCATFYQPTGNLLGLHFVRERDEHLTVLCGPRWGDVYGEGGVAKQVADPCRLLTQMRTSVIVENEPPAVGLRFLTSPLYSSCFLPTLRKSFRRPKELTFLEIYNEADTGKFREAFLQVISKASGRVLDTIELDEFPILPPPLGRPTATAASGKKSADRPARKRASSPKRSPAPKATSAPKTALGPKALPRAAELPKTTRLPVDRMLDAIRAETDDERCWAMIEQNLKLNRPERTYFIVSHFADLVAERIARWENERLRKAFRAQSSHVLELISPGLPVDLILELADEHPERERIMDWLGDREVERLLALPLDGELKSAAAARLLLGVSAEAGPSEIKRVWRSLLGFINVDFGRQAEKAIHQKKDQIAKRLQAARNFLLK